MRKALALVSLAVALSATVGCAGRQLVPVREHAAATLDEGAGGYVPVVTEQLLGQVFKFRWVSDQALTGSMPTFSDGGLSLDGLMGVRPYVCAPSGQTLSGAGSLLVFYLDDYESLVMRNPALDMPITLTSTSCLGSPCQCQVFPDLPVKGGAPGRMRVVPSGVTTSAGTTVRVGLIGGMR